MLVSRNLPLRRANPFDRVSTDEPVLEICIDPHIDFESPCGVRLLKLGSFPFLSVVALPPLDDVNRHFMEEHHIPIAHYHERSKILTVETGTYSAILDETDIVVSEHARDLAAPRSFWQVGPRDVLELVRLLLLHKSIFELIPGYRIDETLYYIYRQQKIFPALQGPWSIAVYRRECGFPAAAESQLASMFYREEFLCRAADYARCHALRRHTEAAAALAHYHLAYFVLLTTGLFDDLAWLAYHLYGLSLKLTDVDLRKKDFRKSARVNNTRLADYIALNEVQTTIRLFYKMRHQFQHRSFPRRIQYQDSERAGHLFALGDEALGEIDQLPRRDGRQKWGVLELQGEFYIDAYGFITRGLSAVADIHANFLERIDWSRWLDLGPPESQAKVCERELRQAGSIRQLDECPYL